jgi:hypothetical protein
MNTKILALRDELKRAEHDKFCREMSDDFAYTNGTMSRCEREITRIRNEIARLEAIEAASGLA